MRAELYGVLMRLERQMHRFRLRWGEDGGPGEHRRILTIISEHEGIIQRELCLMLDIRPSSVTQMLRKLEVQGWVERRPDEKDQRVQHVYMTAEGRARIAATEKEHAAHMEQLFQSLDDEEVREFLRLAAKLADGLDTEETALQESESPRRRHRGFAGWKGGHGRK